MSVSHSLLGGRSKNSPPVTLTEQGRYYLESEERIEMMRERRRQYFCDLSNVQKGRLRIGSNQCRTATLLADLLRTFVDRYPAIDLELVEGGMHEIDRLMLRGEVDFSLTLESFLTDQMDSRVILDENVLIAFPPDHPLGQKARQAEQAGEGYLPFHFPDAANESFLLLKRGLKFHDYFEVLSRKYGITPRVLLQTESITTILELVSKGVACGLVPDSLVAYVKSQPRPAFYSLQHEFAPNRVVAAWNRDLYLSNAARVFIDMLCERHKNERLASG